ncbi:RagB/SusD family nutrient uptake outer membrane protein [Siphonobacter sp. BAB-5385]|uniref:RagB/SusD family nutrient uptake outer membrane protein n=1 Tax=Siphonobacter sp. BAB-5385 TaxID=1864822 RepID=UPI000B9E0110|nr:RagB/SusD family nutrient uptake outer membrane protein [Siphonobacter sp. BAB-5385]OZI05311.1 RagB/SusD family nutrient uptake outer membrane protein [Siphonobacter sp. BAB-5385]
MKKIKFILYGLLPLLMGCNRDFDAPNPNSLTVEQFWQSQNDAVRGVNAVYSGLHRTPLYGRWMFYHTSLRSDEGFGSGGDIGLNNLMSFVQTDYNQNLTAGTWADSYVVIWRANQVLENVPGITMDETVKRRLLAEAKVLRALMYFNLVSLFNRPPLILRSVLTSDTPSNATPEQIWAQIQTDLTEAAPDLPLRYSGDDLGRVTRGSAYGLLGKALMQQRKFQEAQTALAWFITGEGRDVYRLMPNYRDNFIITQENNTESVFEIQFAQNNNETTDDDTQEGAVINVGASLPQFLAPRGVGFSDGAARRWMIGEMQKERTTTGARDPRVEASFLYDSTDVRGPSQTLIYGQTFASRYGTGPDRNSVWFRKPLNDHWKNEEGFRSPNNYRLIRYADILLLYAECLNELGRTTEAYTYVDQIRQRVGLARLTTAQPGLSQAQFRTQIKHERVTELSGEGQRWFDLQRWGELTEANLPALRARDPEFGSFTLDKSAYYPIPQSDLDLNPSLSQNQGY